MSKFADENEKITERVVEGYKKIEDGVVGGYQKVEKGAVEGFNKVSNKFIDKRRRNSRRSERASQRF